jgi:hypothetical protein
MVFVLIEWYGNSQDVDGATIHGVYRCKARADAAAALLHPRHPEDVEIIVRAMR